MNFENRRHKRLGTTYAKYAHKEHGLGILSCHNHIQSDGFIIIEVERQGAELQQSQQQLPPCAAILLKKPRPKRYRPVKF